MRRPSVPGRVRRRGATPSEVVAFGVAIFGLSVLTAPTVRSIPRDSEVRECWAVQHNIDAALDALETDQGPAGTDLATLIPSLVQRGYLSTLPEDPGTTVSGSHRHFGRRVRGAVFCWIHGSPWPDGSPPPRLSRYSIFVAYPPPVPTPSPAPVVAARPSPTPPPVKKTAKRSATAHRKRHRPRPPPTD